MSATRVDPPASASDAQRALEALRASWVARYGCSIDTLQWLPDGDGRAPRLVGSTLTGGQAQAARLLASGLDLAHEIYVLAESASVPPLGFAAVVAPHPLFGEPTLERLQTELVPEEGPARILASDPTGQSWAMQAPDGAIGWTRAGALEAAPPPERWPAARRWEPGVAFPEPVPVDELTDALDSWLGVPYLLGGRTKSGVDCSGLIMATAFRLTGALLPRHSMDQRSRGVRVSRSDMRAGDAVFARMKVGRVSHVGWVLDSQTAAGLDVVHASQRAGCVVREALADFEAHYAFAGARRLWGDVPTPTEPGS